MRMIASFDSGLISIEERGGEVMMFVDREVVPLVKIIARDSGAPGVIGPDLVIDLNSVVGGINEIAIKEAGELSS
jgi:hypothetical protein